MATSPLSDELNNLREQLRRVSAIAETAAAALRERGGAPDAARIERELGIGPARRQSWRADRRPPRGRTSEEF